MEITREELPEQHYIYVEKRCGMGPEIAQAMGEGFGAAFGWLAENGIAPQSMPMTVYTEMPSGGQMVFRCGALVTPEDAAKASGPARADTLPAGPALKALHKGAYASMNQTHDALWKHAKAEGLESRMPVWEIYIDDPGETAEADLRTEVFHAVQG